jgi:hypothetical protein
LQPSHSVRAAQSGAPGRKEGRKGNEQQILSEEKKEEEEEAGTMAEISE